MRAAPCGTPRRSSMLRREVDAAIGRARCLAENTGAGLEQLLGGCRFGQKHSRVPRSCGARATEDRGRTSDARDTATVVSDVLERTERAGSVHELDQADATTSRTSTSSSVTSSELSAAALTRSPAARARSPPSQKSSLRVRSALRRRPTTSNTPPGNLARPKPLAQPGC
jgi:hypothetical protein